MRSVAEIDELVLQIRHTSEERKLISRESSKRPYFFVGILFGVESRLMVRTYVWRSRMCEYL